MKYKSVHTVSWTGNLPEGFSESIELEFPEGEFRLFEVDHEQRRAIVEVNVSVDPEGLAVREEPMPLDESEPPKKSIEVPERSIANEIVQTGTWLLSFVTDRPFRGSARLGSGELIPETVEEAAILEGFETKRIYHGLTLTMEMRSFSLASMTDEQLKKLLQRRFGMALYTEALHMQQPIGRFRELWRLLESAFGLRGRELINAIAAFPPAQDLGFSSNELSELLALRGRASHAESRIGLEEHRRVTTEVRQRLPRLKCLAEQLIITKATWGKRGTAVDRISPLKAFIDPGGLLTIFRSAKPPEGGERD